MKKANYLKTEKILLAVYVAIFLLMLLLNCLTPLNADDFSYSFSFADNSRVNSIGQIVSSMAAHRYSMNGRVVVHGIVSFFLMLPKVIFNVFNALNVVFLLYLFTKFCENISGKWKALLITCSMFLLWNNVPKFSQVFLWLDGSVNYSWSVSQLLLFALPYANYYLYGRRMAKGMFIPFVLFAFLAGTYGESYSPATIIIVALLLAAAALEKKKPSAELVAGLVAAIAGFVFLASAPASQGRVSEFNLSVLINNIKNIVSLAKTELLPLYMLYAGSLAFALIKQYNKNRIILSAIFALGGTASLAAYSIAVNFAPRHLFFAATALILAVIILFSEFLASGQSLIPSVCSACTAVVFVFNLCLGFIDIGAGFINYLERKEAIENAKALGQTEITLEQHIPFTDYGVAFELHPDKTEWPNISVASYYDFEYVIMDETSD